MKRLVCITGVILIACVCMMTFFAPQTSAEAQGSISNQQNLDLEQVYIIKSEENSVVVYKKGELSPFMTTDTLTSSLPKSDIISLNKGIEVKGEINLKKSLEDYCS